MAADGDVASAALVAVTSTREEEKVPAKYLKLNVGGHLFITMASTITEGEHMLSAMFSGRQKVLQDDQGFFLIDRDGQLFGYILNYLRGCEKFLPHSQEQLERLHEEASYYAMPELKDAIAHKLQQDFITSCSVPVLVAEDDMARLVETTTTSLPVVVLSLNRSNNRFSYTAPSHDILLKHIELFDKLCVKFRGRIRYARDISGRDGSVVSWLFCGKGKCVASINCTFIVHAAQDRKHTKIEFPEARLYEENMNMLLYEPDCDPPPDMPATPETAYRLSQDSVVPPGYM
eukprot:m.251754 g.251754  ORF g.251754 m.251754 type:complete len:289 (-) comp15461_c0_seq1:2059-2925(-)